MMGKELLKRKQDTEARGRLIQSEKMEKERLYSNLMNENEKITREIGRLNADNIEKHGEIETLTQDIEAQKRTKVDMELELEKCRKKSKRLFGCC